MEDATGAPLVTRLIDGSGISPGSISDVEFVGVASPALAQSGLFDQLVLHGTGGTTLSMGPGIVLTSGYVTGLPITNTTGSYGSETNTGGNNYFRDFPAQTGSSRHGGRLDENDENSLTFTFDVPANVVGIRTTFVYASDEFPEWSGTQYADGFAFFVDGQNYATLPDGRPVSLLRQEDNIHFMANGYPNGNFLDPATPAVAAIEYDGLTRVLDLLAPVQGGRKNEITIVVADTGDKIYDSAVFLSRFELVFGTAPLPLQDCGVKLRHSSEDDLFVEYGSSPVPEPATLGIGALAAIAMIWRRKKA